MRTDLRPDTTDVHDDEVFVSWHAPRADGPDLVGADTFVMVDGLIAVYTGFFAQLEVNQR